MTDERLRHGELACALRRSNLIWKRLYIPRGY